MINDNDIVFVFFGRTTLSFLLGYQHDYMNGQMAEA